MHLKKVKHKIIIFLNYENLIKFTKIKKLNRKQARWSKTLVNYNFIIKHVLKLKNKRADALSRKLNYKISFKKKKSLLRWNNKRLKLTEYFTLKTVLNN